MMASATLLPLATTPSTLVNFWALATFAAARSCAFDWMSAASTRVESQKYVRAARVGTTLMFRKVSLAPAARARSMAQAAARSATLEPSTAQTNDFCLDPLGMTLLLLGNRNRVVIG